MFNEFIKDYNHRSLGMVRQDEPLSKHTTLRVGGPARLLIQPKDKTSFVEAMKLLNKYNLPFKVLGKGSNLLASDSEFLGVIVKTEKALGHIQFEEDSVTVGAGVSDVKLAKDAAKLGFSGLEFLSGIPGTIGGAVFMNAGAYLREIKDVLVSVQILDENFELQWVTPEALEFSYRHSILQEKPEWIVVEAILKLEKGNPEEALALIRSRKVKRKETQPLDVPSAGSSFRNPEGYAAWQLIDEVGLRSFTIGGAKMSEKHANFVVNEKRQATATDIRSVIDHVKAVVEAEKGIDMHPEVEFFNWEEH